MLDVAKISVQIEVPELVTFSEAAEILGYSRPSLYYMVETGRLHRIDIGGSPYLPRVEVEALKKTKMAEAGVAVAPASE